MTKPTCILSMDDLASRGIPYGRSQIYRKVKDGSFPQPVRLGGNRIGFVEAEVEAWVHERIAERDAKPIPRGLQRAAAEAAACDTTETRVR